MKTFEKMMSAQAAKPTLLDDELVEFVGGDDGCSKSCGMSCDSTCDVTCEHTCGTTELTSNQDPIEP